MWKNLLPNFVINYNVNFLYEVWRLFLSLYSRFLKLLCATNIRTGAQFVPERFVSKRCCFDRALCFNERSNHCSVEDSGYFYYASVCHFYPHICVQLMSKFAFSLGNTFFNTVYDIAQLKFAQILTASMSQQLSATDRMLTIYTNYKLKLLHKFVSQIWQIAVGSFVRVTNWPLIYITPRCDIALP